MFRLRQTIVLYGATLLSVIVCVFTVSSYFRADNNVKRTSFRNDDDDKNSNVSLEVDVFPNVIFTVTREQSDLLQYHDFVTHPRDVWNDVPVVVTAASSNHFKESILLLYNIAKNLRPKFPDIKLIYYDIGLNTTEAELLKEICRCDFRSFPFELFPPHVSRLETFSWKPLIIALMLREFDFVMWTDASIRFDISLSTMELFRNARIIGIQAMSGGGSIAVRTVPETMKFLHVNQSAFLEVPEVQGGWGVYSRTKFTIEKVIKPWALCALSPKCMYPGKKLPLYCYGDSQIKLFGFCHRSDQSVLGIILTQLFPNNRSVVTFEARSYGNVQSGVGTFDEIILSNIDLFFQLATLTDLL